MVCQAGPSPEATPSISSHPCHSTVSLPEATWLSPPKSKAWSADLKGLLCGDTEEAEPSSDHEIVGCRQALRTTSQSHILSPGPPRNLWSSQLFTFGSDHFSYPFHVRLDPEFSRPVATKWDQEGRRRW